MSKKKLGMGFRDLFCFNQALLAKQCWRFLKNEDNLVSRIMKAKYYSRSSVLEAQRGQRPSYAWWSIQWSCGLVKEGLIWRIGNGTSVKIWGDKWLPMPSTYTVQSQPITLTREVKVSALIDEGTRWWNQTLLQENFNQKEVQLIQSILVRSSSQ